MSFDNIMKKMKRQYLRDASNKIPELENLVKLKNFEGLEGFFHKLKGSGSSYGLPEFSKFGEKYESKSKNSTLTEDELKNMVAELKTLCKTIA